MRIAQIHWAFSPTIGGVESHLATLIPALGQRGHVVALLCGQPEDAPPAMDPPDFIIERTPLLDLNCMTYEDVAFQTGDIHETIENFLVRFRPDIIHLHNFHYFTPVPIEAVIAYRHHYGVPVVLTAHNTWNDALFEELGAYRKDYDHIIAVSRFIQNDLIRLGYPGERITPVYHGVTSDWLNAPCSPGYPFPAMVGRPIIFHPARMSLAKGSMAVIEAFALVKKDLPNAFLVLAGTGRTVDWNNVQSGEIREVMERIQELGLTEDVAYRAFGWKEMRSLYDAADVVLYPSIFPEPFGIAVIEAMARGKPVIVARSGGMPEIIEDGSSGLIVSPGSVQELSQAILEVLQHSNLRHMLGLAAQLRVRERFTAEQMVSQTETVLVNTLREMASSHGAPVAF